MKTNIDKAVDNFDNGFNCAQSVLSVFSEKYNLKEELALKITSGLGGGFRTGEICGVVSGAVLVIGLKYGQSVGEDKQSKIKCNSKTEEFISLFRSKNGTILCRELLGCDISTVEGREKAQNENLFKTICEEKVRNAVKLLEELGY